MTHGRHWTPLGVDGSAVSNQLSFDSVIMGRKKETEKFCLCKEVVGCHCGVLGLLSNEELIFPDPEWVVGGIGASFSVLAGPEEEEEGKPGEVDTGDVS